jgi:hypothetical protein
MKVITALAVPLVAAATLYASPVGDEFTDPSLAGWQAMTGEIGDGGTTSWAVEGGQLIVHVAQSSWVDARHAFYLWKSADGDFDVSARVLTTSEHKRLPGDGWSLAGLLVRDPRAAGTPKERWLGWTVGRVRGQNVFERKTTQAGSSQLVLLRATRGWVDLRIVRRGARFSLYRRYPGKKWVKAFRYVRSDLGPQLQVGIDAQSGFGAAADLVAHVDWVRFAPTR